MRFEDMVLEIRGAGRERLPMPLPEAIIHRMKEAAGRHQRSRCPFAIGSLVTARKGGSMDGDCAGVPSLVIDMKVPEYHWHGGIGQAGFGVCVDMRILMYRPEVDAIQPFWVDSAEFEQYVAEEPAQA